jgi:hypothetical protein
MIVGYIVLGGAVTLAIAMEPVTNPLPNVLLGLTWSGIFLGLYATIQVRRERGAKREWLGDNARSPIRPERL